MSRSARTRSFAAVLAAGTALASTVVASIVVSTPARAMSTTGWIVSVGDSYISGEAGRWAGNANSSTETDALGSTAYWDTATGEAIPGCHRSKSAEVYIGDAPGENLACSGAASATVPYQSGSDFKPGLDFYNDGAGHIGQALALEQFASTHNVHAVAVSIGGNDFDFASIVQDCVADFLLSPSWWKNYCDDDSSVTSQFTSTAVGRATAKIKQALLNVRSAMQSAGYADSTYSIIVQTYPSPLPNGSSIRYSQSGYSRQTTGGCGFWNADADWSNATALPTINKTVRAAATATGLTNIEILDVSALFTGHRLCENTDHKLQETSYTSWTQPGAVDVSEWIENIRTVTAITGPYSIQESLHPNYWGQLALRDCLRQAYDRGVGGSCVTSGTGLNANGEPRTTLVA